MVNIMSFKAADLSYLDSPINDTDPTTPRQVILNLNGLEEDTKLQKIFISIKKIKTEIMYYL